MTRGQRIAIVGAGPIGIDAALAGLEQGFSVRLFEAAETVGGHIQRWRHVRLFTPWELDLSPRMRLALRELGIEPAADRCPMGEDLLSRALEPLASRTALRGCLHLGTKVLSIGRKGLLKHEEIGSRERASRPFRILTRKDGTDGIFEADVVLDCSGLSCANPLGDGGMRALGETENRAKISYDIPRVQDHPEVWSEGTTMIVGAGHSAQTAARDIAAAIACGKGESGDGSGKLVWIVRGESLHPGHEDDPLPERRALMFSSSELARNSSQSSVSTERVEVVTGSMVEEIVATGDGLEVTLGPSFRSAQQRRTIAVARLVALTGRTGDHSLSRQLQVHQCYATEGPMKLAAALLATTGAASDCLAQSSHGVDTLTNPEPDFFILGSKSYGRRNDFLLRVGYQQVNEVFELLALVET